MAVIEPKQYKSNNPRIDGIKLLQTVLDSSHTGMQIQRTKIITDESFRYYLKHKEFSPDDLENLKQTYFLLKQASKNNLLAVRRAYKVPGIVDPPGPRFLGIESQKKFLNAIKSIFNFAIEQNYYVNPKSKIEAFFYPFTDPPIITPPIKSRDILPHGGYAIPLDKSANYIKILAVFGNQEGVQSLKALDEYIVDVKKQIIKTKNIGQKRLGIFTSSKKQDDKLTIPPNRLFDQVYNDLEILEIAQVTSQCTKIAKKPIKTEFSSDHESTYFNEAIKYEIPQVEGASVHLKGKIHIINNQQDIKTIPEGNKTILYISRDIVVNRDYTTLNSIAGLKGSRQILYPGENSTAHAMRVLIDAGHSAVTIGKKEFTNNEQVNILINNKGIEIHRTNNKFIPLNQASENPKNIVGSKAYNLSILSNNGFQIPDGYVLSSELFKDKKYSNSKNFETFINKLPDSTNYAVRSSSNLEDTAENALAGQFLSITKLKKSQLKKAINDVYNSKNAKHLRQLKIDSNLSKMAVIVQKMIEPKYAGLIFGGNIETKNTQEVVLELIEGYAEEIVDNKLKAQKFTFNKTTGEIVSKPAPINTIKNNILESLFEMYIQIEKLFGSIQDVEWSIDKKGELFVLQSRDLIV